MDKRFLDLHDEELGNALLKLHDTYQNTLTTRGYYDLWKKNIGFYYNNQFKTNDASFGHNGIMSGGEANELSMYSTNHFRSILRHMHQMATKTRISMQCVATTTEPPAMDQCKIGNKTIEHYQRTSSMEESCKLALEAATVMNCAYLYVDWNPMFGEPIAFDEDAPDDMYFSGDADFQVIYPWFVILQDITETDFSRQDWCELTLFKNKYDLAELYPEYGEEILKKAKTKGETLGLEDYYQHGDENEMIQVHYFYHRRRPSRPDGQYIVRVGPHILENNPFLGTDEEHIHDDIPLYQIRPTKHFLSALGYSTANDLIGMQEAYNVLRSSTYTNQAANAVSSIMGREGTYHVEDFEGGLRFIDVKEGVDFPQVLNLTNTPKEVLEFPNQILKDMEGVSGVNSTARGEPDKNLKSGVALSLIQAVAVEFISEYQAEYVKMCEWAATQTVELLKSYGQTERMISIVGDENIPALM